MRGYKNRDEIKQKQKKKNRLRRKMEIIKRGHEGSLRETRKEKKKVRLLRIKRRKQNKTKQNKNATTQLKTPSGLYRGDSFNVQNISELRASFSGHI